MRLCLAYPGNPRCYIEGESPQRGTYSLHPTAIVTTPTQHLTQGRRPHMTLHIAASHIRRLASANFAFACCAATHVKAVRTPDRLLPK